MPGLSMGVIELCCFGILALGLLLRSRAPGFDLWRRDAWIVAVGALVAEDSSIHLYGFYDYHAPWHLWVDQVPVLVAVIWVFVVLSARDVAQALQPRYAILLGYAIVLYDAALVEPVATHAGLWRWHHAGPFAVPWIGMLGWAFYGGTVLFWLEKLPEGRRWLAIVLAPLTMHALLLASWWLALRWVGRDAPAPIAVAGAALGLAVVLAVVVRRLPRVPWALVAPRIAPALFFFGLLAWTRGPEPLWGHALTFALPWLAAIGWKSTELKR